MQGNRNAVVCGARRDGIAHVPLIFSLEDRRFADHDVNTQGRNKN